jgi:photosystem II stability/assembly factor-like uncharacterized protein
MKGRILAIFTLYLFIHFVFASVINANLHEQTVEWEEIGKGLKDVDLYTVAADPHSAKIIYVSSLNAVYRTIDGGEKWKEIFSTRGNGDIVNVIIVSPSNPETIYVATNDGLYRSKDRGLKWERIFKGVGASEKAVLSIAENPLNPDIVYIGTQNGIFLTKNSGKTWTRGQNIPFGVIVSSIAIDRNNPHVLYCATDRGIFKSLNSGVGWKKIYTKNLFEEDELNSSTTEEDNLPEPYRIREELRIRSIALDPFDNKVVYVGTSRGLIISRDGGLTWKTASSLGLLSRDIRHIIVSKSDRNLYAATNRGVFKYSMSMKIWEEFYRGIASSDIRYLAALPAKLPILLAATKKGIYKTVPDKNSSDKRKTEIDSMLQIFAHEPSIEEIREAAILYAEVSPEKIRKWRKAATKKAWLPKLTFGYEQKKDWQSSDYFYSTSKEKYKDDDITEERDRKWSISLTWELGDLIWNDDQTSIDVRSRLMVQLRDDILNEVTRLYFERRRLQYELYLSPPVDIKEKIEKELRLQELTAGIDALTGSYLSKRLAQIKGKRY